MFSLMQASSFGTRKRGLIIVTLALGAVLTACGGGTSRKKTDTVGGGPAFTDCVTTAKASAATAIAGGSIVDGAQLYDRWYTVVGAPTPTADQALWATRADTSVNKSVEDTWRCKTCHGWDYAGRDGAYKSGSSSYTGFPGVLAAKEANAATPENIFCAIKVGTATSGAEHAFGGQLGDDAHAWNLTKFILDVNGVINTSQYIAANKGIFNSNVDDGAAAYTSARCANCHGSLGELYADDGAGLGFLAMDNPWEVLHKIRFGDPDVVDGLNMVAYQSEFNSTRGLSVAQIASLIAWAQGVPPDGLTGGTGTIAPGGTPGSSGGGSGGGTIPTVSGKFLGALIYDSIAGALSKTITVGNPFWDELKGTTATPTTDAGTWRCKNCHGWDYKGISGVNANGFSLTRGPTNLFDAQGKTKAQLKLTIRDGYNINTTSGVGRFHAFGLDPSTTAAYKNGVAADTARFVDGPGLSDVEIDAVVDFIQTGLLDTQPYVGVTKSALGGDGAAGSTMYTSTATTASKGSSCSSANCHGDQGKAIDFDSSPTSVEYVGTIALENPWEFFHKVRWGQPASNPPMGGTVEAGIDDKKIVDLLRFAQTLPVL